MKIKNLTNFDTKLTILTLTFSKKKKFAKKKVIKNGHGRILAANQ